MKAPHFEQADMLCVCIRQAAHELGELIEHIVVEANEVQVWGPTKYAKLDATYANSLGPGGAVAPGGGHWVVQGTQVLARSPDEA